MTEPKTTPIRETHVDAIILASKLREIKEGDEIGYAVLSQAIHADVQGNARHHLERARIILLREGMVFETLRTKGLRRCLPEDVLRVTEGTFEHVRRTARLGGKKLGTADFNRLDNKGKLQKVTQGTVLAMVAEIAKPKSLELMSGKIAALPDHPERLAIGHALDLWRNGNGKAKE